MRSGLRWGGGELQILKSQLEFYALVVETPDVTALVDNDTRPVFAVNLDAAHVEIFAYPPALDLKALAELSRFVIIAFQGTVVIR